MVPGIESYITNSSGLGVLFSVRVNPSRLI